MGGTQNDYGQCLAVDANGNVYVTGNFNGNSVFGSVPLYANAGTTDIFLIKYSSNGEFQWEKQVGGT